MHLENENQITLGHAREQSGYSIEQAANIFGLSKDILLAYEKDTGSIPCSTFITMLRLYNIRTTDSIYM